MSRLPRVTGRQMLRALRRGGFVVVRVVGSHHFLSHPEDPTRWATVPVHAGKILPPKVVQANPQEHPAVGGRAKGAPLAARTRLALRRGSCSREKAAAAGPGAGALRRPVAGPEPGRDAIRDARRGPEGRAVARLWEMYRRGLEISFYDLRHLHATYLLQLGVHPKVVAEDLGHSTTRLTLDTYSHVAPTLQQEAADKLDGLLRRNL